MENYTKIDDDGTQKFYKNYAGFNHRLDGPAREIYAGVNKGTIEYYLNGSVHRVGGPSLIEYKNDSLFYKSWRRNGQLHRLNAPAKMWFGSSSFKEYWEFGDKIK